MEHNVSSRTQWVVFLRCKLISSLITDVNLWWKILKFSHRQGSSHCVVLESSCFFKMPFLTLVCIQQQTNTTATFTRGKKNHGETGDSRPYATESAQLILLLFLQSDLPDGIWNNAISFLCQHSLLRWPLASLQYTLTHTGNCTPESNWNTLWSVQLSMPKAQQEWFNHDYRYGQDRGNKHITLLESSQPPQYQRAGFHLIMFLRPIRKRLFWENVLWIIMYFEKLWLFFFNLFKREFE